MSITAKVKKLANRLEDLTKLKIQNEVITNQAIKALEKKFGVDNYEDGDALLEETTKQREKLETKLTKLYDKFDEEFGEYLEELGV